MRTYDRIYKLADGSFNINSPKQLGFILFEKLGISTKGIKKTPRILKEQGMPLWNIALEIHVGRFFINWIKCMSSSVYVNISGILILIVLILS